MKTEMQKFHTDWRDRAIQAALAAEARYGDGMDSLLWEIGRHQAGSASLTLNPDRLQLLCFLRKRATRLRSLLSFHSGHIEREQVCPYVGWYAAEWEGRPVEIVFSPDYALTGDVIALAEDEAFLHRFANALEDYTIRPAGRCLRYSNHWASSPELDAEIGKVTWDDLILAPDVYAGVREAVEGFFRYRDAFTALGFPWRRGVLLIGPPGTGKTMICKAAAAALPNLPFLYVRDFEAKKRENHEDAITEIFRRARKLAPCLLVFEDVDGLVTEANRAFFLNELDGFHNNNGLLIIASSNHPHKIDEALLKRPSRFDRVFHIGLPALSERRAYCLRLLSRSTLAERLSPSLDIEALAQSVAERAKGFTPAYLKEVFVSAALRQAQEGTPLLDERFARSALEQVEELQRHLKRLRNPDTLGDFHAPEAEPLGIRRNRVG